MPDHVPPAELEGYEAIEPLGESATATLLRARTRASGTSVVVKLLKTEHPTPEQVARLAHEHHIVQDLDLAGVVRPLRVERFKHRVGLVLEDTGGSSLRSIIGPTGLDVETFLRIAIPLVRTLGQLHDADVIHKDLNPSNIIVDDTLSTVQITDFGIASRLPRVHRQSAPGDRLEGTLAYLSPEQTGRMNRAVDHRSDFYALGATFYEALTGKPPFTAADPMELVHCHLAVRPAPPRQVNPAVPEALSDVVLKLLAKSPQDRYQSAYGLLRDLEVAREAWRKDNRIDAFPLGRHDVASGFRIPDRLYGRAAETAKLTASLARVADGSAELMLLLGASGVGKSVLVHEVEGPTAERRGYFIRGKFDQYSGSAPYASLIDAVRELVRQLLGQPPERIAAWREKILTALAGNAGVVAEVVPDVTLVTGPVPSVTQLGPTETQNRFNLVFRQFLRTFAGAEHPLVIFLDDLHWADAASVRLLRTLVSDPDARHLLIIAAYRPEAVDPDGPLGLALGGLDPSSVRRIELGPLRLDTVTELVADTVGAPRKEAAALARLVHERTAGNPFFVNQFLHSLYEDGLIRFAVDTGRWTWDLAGIRERGITDNVVDLMAGRVGELPVTTKEALRIAAVIGHTFDLDLLAAALGREPSETARRLDDAVRAGFVLPLSADHELVAEGLDIGRSFPYRFLHDRVQQACHSLIDPGDLPAVHRRLGELLLERLRDGDRADAVFEVVTHLNAGIPAIPSADLRVDLAELNLEAARKARASNAYDAVLSYAEAGAARLPPDHWDQRYDLAFGLRLLRAQAQAVLGRVDEAEADFAALLSRARPGFDRAKVCDVRSEVLLIAGRPADAYAAGRAGLEHLGIMFPATAEDQANETEALYSMFLDVSMVDRLAELGHGGDEAALAGSLFWRSTISAYWSHPTDLPLLVVKHADYILRNGLNPHMGGAIGFLSMVIMLRGQIETAMAYGEAGLALADRFDDDFYRSRARLMPWMTLMWKYPFAVSERAFHDVTALCYRAGDLEFVNHSMIGAYICAHVAGKDFPAILERCERWLDFCLAFAPLEAGQARIRATAHRRLMSLDPRPDDPQPFDPEAILRNYEAQGDLTDVAESLEELTRIETLFGNYAVAYAYAGRAEPLVAAGAAGTLLFNYLFWMDHAICAARVGDLAKADALLEKMRPFAEFNPDNFESFFALAEAERARAGGDSDEAVRGYLRSIEHADAHGYVLLEAFANELLARHYHERGHRFALAHFQEAEGLYLECGARGKALVLEEEIPELRQATGGPGGPLGLLGTPTTERGSAHLDLGTALKASLAIAGEIALERVVARLVGISIENAGAERGVFVSVDGEDLRVEAEGVAGGDVHRYGAVPLDDGRDVVPAGLVRTAARTGEAIVLPEALVLPITRKGEVNGVLYLENTLVTGAFTPERLALLEVLSGQMAISLENARLYAHLEEKVVERTRELSDALDDVRAMQYQMVESEKLAALGSLVAGMAHEINTPVGIAVTAASHLVDRTDELWTDWQAGAMKRSTLDRYIESVDDAGRLILANLERSNELVQSFKQVAVDQSSEARRTFVVRPYLEDILRSLRPSLKRSPHLLEVDCDPGITLTSYPGALAQVVTNFVLNSVAHGYDHGVTGRISLAVTAYEGGLQLRHADDGRGIPDDVRQRIFEPFFTTRRAQGGSGLGLHIVYNLVTQRLGGTIGVRSAPGAGTEFIVDLPDLAAEPADG